MYLCNVKYIDHLHMSDFDSKIILFTKSYFPLRRETGPSFIHNSMTIAYIVSHNIL